MQSSLSRIIRLVSHLASGYQIHWTAYKRKMALGRYSRRPEFERNMGRLSSSKAQICGTAQNKNSGLLTRSQLGVLCS